MRKMIACILAIAMLFSMAAFAGAENADREYVEIEWYFHDGGTSTAYEEVDAKVNEYFLEKLNTKVNVHHIADYDTKMPTLISSGQDLGIIMFGTNLSYPIQATREAFYPLDELLPEYAPKTYSLFSEQMWDGMRINGSIYGVPAWKDNCYIMSMYYNQDMADELGIDVESYDFNVYTDLIPLFYEAKEKRDALHPEYADYPISGPRWGIFPYDFAIECFLDELLCCNITGLVEQGADGIDPSQVYCLFETDDFRAYALQMQQLVEDGIYPYEAPADIWNSEKVFCWPGWGYVTIDEHMVSPDFVSTLYVPNIWWTDTGNLQTAGYAISSMCAHPDRAMEVLELLNTDTYVATTMRFGIEGTHWVRDEEGKITFEGTINERRDVYYRWYGNEIGGMSAVEVPEINGGQAFIDLLHQYNDSATLTDHLGFVFDTTNVSNEVAACNNVYSEYKNNLQNGLYESQEETEAMLDEFLAKLQANGLDTLKTECQAQIDAWTAAQAN